MIRADGICYRISEREILQDVSLSAEKGEFVGLIGPNGSGKSTLLKNLYKLLTPQKGTMVLMEQDLRTMSNREMAQRLGVVVQEHDVSFDFTVEEVILMGRYARKTAFAALDKEDRDRLQQVVRMLHLERLVKQSFPTLSGGEKQRVLIARALIQDTPCLILDEPTNHLDIKYQLELMEIVRGLDRTVLSAIHDLNIAAAYCDTLYALKDGKIVASGTPKELLTSAFLSAVYEVKAEVMTLPDGTPHVIFYGGRS